MSGPDAERPVVVVVAHSVHDHGGMERATAELIRRGRDRYRFVVIAREVSPELRGLVEWRRVRAPARPAPARFLVFFVLAGWSLRRERARRLGAIVHTVGAIVPNRVDVATVHYIHATAPRATRTRGAGAWRRWNSRVDHRISVWAERWSYRRRTRVLAAVSGSVADDLARAYPGVQVAVTPNGVDPEHFRPDATVRASVRSARGATPDDVVVLFLGGDWGRKGLDVLLDGLGDPSVRPLEFRLWVVGPGDEARASADAVARGVASQIDFVGPVDDAAPLYAAADLFVLPSAYETFGLAAFEAAASGLPVVATAVGEIPALVGDGGDGRVGGVLVARDAASVADGIRPYLVDPERRARDGETARQRAGDWGWAASVDAVAAVYAELRGSAR